MTLRDYAQGAYRMRGIGGTDLHHEMQSYHTPYALCQTELGRTVEQGVVQPMPAQDVASALTSL